jgi:diaminopimelate decarboxylase
MEPFAYVQDLLRAEGVSLVALAERYGTPSYVYSRSAILENLRRIQSGLAGIPSLVCYSVKANSNLKILSLLGEAGAGFDIVSGGELARVGRARAVPDRVVFSGVGKTAEEIDAALAAGILMFNVESEGELEVVEARAAAAGKVAPVAIRVNPDVEAETHPYISTGRVIHKFGVPKDAALALYRRAASSKHLRVRGIACHIGSQILKVEPFLKALDEILEVGARLAEQRIEIEWLDLGGGYGIRYQAEAPLEMDRLLRQLKRRIAPTPYRLILEPGRAIVGDAGILLTRVLYLKPSRRKTFVVVDSGMNDLLRPALYGSQHQVWPVLKRPGAARPADVVGPLCETGDFLARDRQLAPLRPGDLLAVMTAGAYGFALSSNYNSRPRPAELLVGAGEVELIRARERLEDLMAGESGAERGMR